MLTKALCCQPVTQHWQLGGKPYALLHVPSAYSAQHITYASRVPPTHLCSAYHTPSAIRTIYASAYNQHLSCSTHYAFRHVSCPVPLAPCLPKQTTCTYSAQCLLHPYAPAYHQHIPVLNAYSALKHPHASRMLPTHQVLSASRVHCITRQHTHYAYHKHNTCSARSTPNINPFRTFHVFNSLTRPTVEHNTFTRP